MLQLFYKNNNMKIRIEASSLDQAKMQLAELIHYYAIEKIETELIDDQAPFGDDESLLITSIVFLVESIKSGIAWDLIKELIVTSYSMIPSKRRGTTIVEIEYKENSKPQRIKLAMVENEKEITILLPNKTKISIK
ncbi:hypothetical protein [Leptospira alexanderi]|uniref:hypothetical protein n=1 Tax=Leptospira alexanderi TaxID=100053 RepID=UPI00099127D6|nr:hypothetical protein [Leptospira alexanderi]